MTRLAMVTKWTQELWDLSLTMKLSFCAVAVVSKFVLETGVKTSNKCCILMRDCRNKMKSVRRYIFYKLLPKHSNENEFLVQRNSNWLLWVNIAEQNMLVFFCLPTIQFRCFSMTKSPLCWQRAKFMFNARILKHMSGLTILSLGLTFNRGGIIV